MATIEPTKENFERTVTGSDMGIVDIRARCCAPRRPFAQTYGAASERRSLWGNPA